MKTAKIHHFSVFCFPPVVSETRRVLSVLAARLRTPPATSVSSSSRRRRTTPAGTRWLRRTTPEWLPAPAGWTSTVNTASDRTLRRREPRRNVRLPLQRSGTRASRRPRGGPGAAATRRWRARGSTSGPPSPRRGPAPSCSPAAPPRPRWRARSCERRRLEGRRHRVMRLKCSGQIKPAVAPIVSFSLLLFTAVDSKARRFVKP